MRTIGAMPPDFRRLLRGALITSPSLLAACNRPPPAVAPEEVSAPAVAETPTPEEPVATAEIEPGNDREAPRIRSARFINPQRVRLSFTEPIAPTDGVNPRQFRISVSYMAVESEGYGYATYADVSYLHGDEDNQLVVRRLERYADERELGLDLSRPVPIDICADIKDVELERLEAAGLAIVGRSPDGRLAEMVELDDHPYFVACQFHPEFKSRPLEPHPLFNAFVRASLAHREARDDG